MCGVRCVVCGVGEMDGGGRRWCVYADFFGGVVLGFVRSGLVVSV